MMKLSSNRKVMVVLLVLFVFCDILLSPVGFETRASAILSNSASLPWFGLLIVGLILNVASLILIFFKPHVSSILAIIGSPVYILVLIADQAGLVTSIKPPLSITYFEIVTFIVLVLAIFYSARVYRESPAKISGPER